MFKEQEKENGLIFNEFLKKGVNVNMMNWREIVVNRIIDNAPRY